MLYRIAFGCLLVVAFYPLFGQEQKSSQQLVEELVETLAEGSDAELDFTSLTEDLIYLAENPLNLNTAQPTDLEKLPFLTDFQVMSLIDYRSTYGSFLTIYELPLVSGFDFPTIRLLLPFVRVAQAQEKSNLDIKKTIKYSQSELLTRVSGIMEQPDGYQPVPDSLSEANPNDYYPGNRMRYYAKYKFSIKEQVQAGITAEKDPGEAFFKGPQPNGFDFYSAHLQFSKIGILETAVLGDFEAHYGQGLVMGSYLSNSKSSLVMDIRKKYEGLKKYSSTDENQYFRGAGATVALGDFKLSAFGSYKPLDANLEASDTTLTGEYGVTSLQVSGIHATPSQLEDKHTLKETMMGGNIQYRFHQFRIGITGVTTSFSNPFTASNHPEDNYQFTGTRNQNLGADFLWTFRSIYLFGEGAVSSNKRTAGLVGTILQLTPQVSLSMLYRNYDAKFQTLYGNAFAESGKNQNERGFYSGIQLFPIKKWKLSAYYDFYRFPMTTSQADGPSKGHDFMVQADFATNRAVSMYWRLKKETNEGNLSTTSPEVAPLVEQSQWHFRYHINYTMSGIWHFKNRVEVSQYQQQSGSNEYGFLLYQDVSCDPARIPLSVTLRYAVYQTGSYNTRIYAYESDVLNAYSVPALYDKGSRFYLLLQYQFLSNVECWVRFSQTAFTQRTEVGSGIDRVPGNHKSELKAQVRWRF
ncbi:MAG TPA: hypothetical protein DCQ26_08465 [Marinilabiliales bacterium]|nr:MAG: hypothetical protein A2W96_09340 [Bacteroidetes bacterium GWD2_40_43]OFX94968.1 MAG: hypothetical protein A2W97_16500 [Bacteroidetes bacterium GWE2_40_63]OFY23480.1 MAG: hypothetical protein A2W88_08315 [Bacteroidetes bacterium GWF2_40_13]OFZ29394.1 MAG: hypothetical protein A2437_09285 [Bacteroidetes bacterium RIFOXYC2_FULL_40_12]HAM98632.1 hypothetical protein [Marinilabiliales bacterium]